MGKPLRNEELGCKWENKINIIGRLNLVMDVWSVFFEIWAYCKNIMYMRHAQELLIHYESTKYIYGQKNNVFRYEKSKSLFQNVPPQCIQFCTVNKITTVYVFFN